MCDVRSHRGAVVEGTTDALHNNLQRPEHLSALFTTWDEITRQFSLPALSWLELVETSKLWLPELKQEVKTADFTVCCNDLCARPRGRSSSKRRHRFRRHGYVTYRNVLLRTERVIRQGSFHSGVTLRNVAHSTNCLARQQTTAADTTRYTNGYRK